MSFPRGDRTATVTTTEVVSHIEGPPSVTLLLRPTETEEVRPRLRWAETTVDNEFMGKRSSKKCCIFHKRRAFNEDSSSEEDGGEKEDSSGGGAGGTGVESGKGGGGGGQVSEQSLSGGHSESAGKNDSSALPGIKKAPKKRGVAEGVSSEGDIANCPHCQYLQKLKAERS
jgi:protein phosphatase 1 regulatory subunit 11